jgi:pumilio family protein 6
MDVIRDNVKDVVFKHDASRIVQTVVKYGGQKDRDEVAVELKGHYKELAQNKYSKVRLTHFVFPWEGELMVFGFRSSW